MDIVNRLNHLLDSFDECRILSFDGSRLIVIGDWDLFYHHNFEAEFWGVSYTQCPTYFNAQTFRLATLEERSQLQTQFNLPDYTNEEDSFFCFESDGHCFFIAARSISLREGLVMHS